MASVLIPTPAVDFDPTEVAVSWRVLTRLGHKIVFATPHGQMARADELMLTGEGLDLWGFMPVLRRVVAIGVAWPASRDVAAVLHDESGAVVVEGTVAERTARLEWVDHCGI